MGLNEHSARFLLEAYRDAVPFRRTLLLGRQQLYLHSETLRGLSAEFGTPALKGLHERDFAEPFFHSLGAGDVQSMDAWADEGATIVHDLNHPLPAAARERFDVVFDGGTLEHVFNFPLALKNAMEAVAIGGRLMMATPANNQVNHGFYQFSPELFQAALSPENGFELERLIVVDMVSGHWYEPVGSSPSASSRALLISSQPLELLIRARRVASLPIFETYPAQAYYVSHAGHHVGGRLRNLVERMGQLPGGTMLTKLAQAAHGRWSRHRAALRWNHGFRRVR